MNYVPLHCHSDASLDGAGTVDSLVAEAKRLGMSHLALTDHGTLANSVAFWSACTDAGILPIIGLEAYILYKAKRHHITLLSTSELGFNNLITINNKAHKEGWSGGYPLTTLDDIAGWTDIFSLSGCASSAVYEGSYEQGLEYVGDLREAMGKSNMGLEVQFLGTHDTWTRPLHIAKQLNLPWFVTNDTHYPCRGQFHAHQTICGARRGFTYDSEHLWLKSGDEIMYEGDKWAEESVVEKGLYNTIELANGTRPFDMRSAPSLPFIDDVEKRMSDALKERCKEDVALKGSRPPRFARLQYEWKVLKEKGFLDYIFILWDIVAWAKREKIYVGPGRGSGGGSYVLYLLGITNIDPIEYGLVFERFINPGRSDYPDVDVDFESDRRSEVMEYAMNRWGTVPIATYSCYSHKSAVHDIARVLKIPKTLEVKAADDGPDSEAFSKFLDEKDDALNTYNTMMGQIRHRGKHAAGVIIANRPVPIERAGDELVAAWAEGMNTKDLSKVGIVKYDLLGLTALSQLKTMAKITDCDPRAIAWSYDQPEVFDIFCKGDVAGIFQWSGSEGIRELTRRIAPRNFYDLTTCNALYRPGALDAGTAEKYPEYMKEPRFLHPRIDPHLEKTYGVFCYQEQVMAVVAEVMGGDLAQADVARKLLSKAAVGDVKWEAEIAGLYASFTMRGKEQGFSERLLEQLWEEIYTHSGYSYNLAHASAYTMISYQMAWFKAHFRTAFLTSVLQYDKPNAQTYILDAVQHDIEVRMPSIEYSIRDYSMMYSTTLCKDIIHLPLTDIAYLGEKAVDYILKEREANGPFRTYEEFSRRIPKKVCNNRAKTMLERIGAFADLDGDPSAAIADYEEMPLKTPYENQLEILGYVIPSAAIYAKMEEIRSRPAGRGYTRFAGFIASVKKKRSLRGEYFVFELSPHGSFWCREPSSKLVVGKFVSGTKSSFGNSTDVKSYKL